MLYGELDENRFEVRKVEVFCNGECGYAGANESWHGTKLGEVAMPEFDEVGGDPQFEPVEITRDEFEVVCSAVTRNRNE